MTPWLQWDVWQVITRDKEGSRASIYLIEMEGRASHHHGYSGRYVIIPPWLWWDAGHPITLVTVGDGATHRLGYSERPNR